nr:unnamed protein product [Digitaria exilis]
MARGFAVPASWGHLPTAGDATGGTRGEAQFGLGFGGGTRGRGRRLSKMFDWNEERQQVGDAIWAEFNESENHILPYPNGAKDMQLDGKCEVFGNDHEEKSSSFLDCDWGNIGDFDDFDRLFSSNDSMFGNEMVTNGREFLSSLDLMDNAAQSVPIPQVPLSKQPSAEHGPSFLLVNEVSRGISKQESKVADANSKSGEQVECKNHLT